MSNIILAYYRGDVDTEVMRILVVDNNVELCSVLTEFFDSQPDMETAGVAYDGEEALTKLEETQPDVMILDITMPHLDGIGVLERMQGIQLKTRPYIIVLTAFSRDELVTRLTELGVDFFVVKPFNLAMLAERVRQFTKDVGHPVELNGTSYGQDLSMYHQQEKNENMEKRIIKMLHEMGVPPHFKGFTYLRDAVVMCQSRGYVGGGLTKEIYPTLATKYNATIGGVEAAIRNAVVTAWENGNTEYISGLCGSHREGKVPTNSLIIAKLAEEVTVVSY